ncbi:MAG TPA: hypothetical protein VFO52_11025 [Longimicrobiales bacterium]|nr:hypothetical protein [Longimicrobiales bacterium]
METQTIFCSACDREVLIRLTPEGKLEGAVCMDIGQECTGTLCPICAEPPEAIRRKLPEVEKQAHG